VLLLAAAGVTLAVGISSYGIASDLAVTFGYVFALCCGAFPLAIDRERRRSHLMGASPVAPWAWALGSGMGAGLAALVATLVLFAAAGIGGAAAGGVETRVAHPIAAHGTVWLLPARRIDNLPPEAEALRTEVRTYRREDAVEAPGDVALRVDGREVSVPTWQTATLPARAPEVEIRSERPDLLVGIVADRTRILGEERSFLANALLAGLAPALVAFGLAAVGVAAGANLSAPVAALLAGTLLLAASLKGFLLDTWEHEGTVAAAVAGEEHEGHDHAPVGRAPEAVRSLMRAILEVLPDLPALDASDRVARGEWAGAGLGRSARLAGALRLAAVGLACAGALGGIGVFLRRTP